MFGTWQNRIRELKEQISQKQQRIGVLGSEISQDKNACLSKIAKLNQTVTEHFSKSLANHSTYTVEQLSQYPPYHFPVWQEEIWENWAFNGSLIEKQLCVGKYLENKRDIPGISFTVPAFIPFIGSRKTFIFQSNTRNEEASRSFFQSVILRVALMLPHQTIFTLLDPAGFGKAFPLAGQLNCRDSSGDVYRVLEQVASEMRRIITTYGLTDNKPFDAIAENILINEQFEFIFAADFPKGYDRRAIEKLQSIASNGTIAGKYVFIQHNTDVALPRDMDMAGFENAFIMPLSIEKHSESLLSGYSFVPDSAPTDNLGYRLLEKLKDSKPPEKTIDWQEEAGLPESNWWTCSATEFIETSVGRSGSQDKLNIWFGAKKSEGNRPCAHGMLGAMTGSGKSNLYHVLILGLSIRYSPEELKLYLIDGKDGVEFQPYKDLPHTEVLSLKSLPQLSRSILTEIVEEKERRNNLFTLCNVRSFEEYKNLSVQPQKLPRILLLIDEYQELFEGDKEGQASNTLLAIAQQGRSAGIHMFLGSQKFGAVGMLHQQAIFGNIHLRAAMKMTLSDRNALTEFGREGKQFIATCDVPGKVVVNDQSGDDGANKIGKVALLKSKIRDEVINLLIKKAQDQFIPIELLSTNVFNGNEQPQLLDNPQIDYLVRQKSWLSEKELEDYARRDISNGGIGEVGWFAGEKPLVSWLGQEFNVRGFAKIIFRRRRAENAIIVGDRNDTRYGMLCSMLTSIALNSDPESYQFIIVDRSIPATSWSGSLKKVKEILFDKINAFSEYITKSSEIELV